MKEIAKEAWNYTLSEEQPGSYVLSVVCGGVGMYDFAIRLTPAQAARYGQEGIAYIAGLAADVRHDQRPFEAQRA
ncbi:hypothetical protein [Dyadobacter fermentans]|uniref:Uncharacterized protein n=1 Tax=Dyadobacter fermentans (strain ATCC 700827 / DSM 18053 / CIP 107007 / KCTC 52180 / NS114) TaxID=471854 RepID=C6VRK9_DYAFD|nr:hypothetical protein [Dyadobacter fermentans]ACT92712.1 hypothetical protein Dfer_1466 [Dyadobacter fermentans DSM 18053]